jgi:hypothetical protein
MSSPPTLQTFPTELLLQILTYLDIPDLLQLTRTTHHLRTLSLDPLLHVYRLRRASFTIETYIPVRTPLTDLLAQRIYITRTTLAARSLGRDFIRIKLNRMLGRRPSAESLVGRGVLPRECLGLVAGEKGYVAPSLIETKRRVERERVKDVLRHWVEDWRRRGCEKGESVREGRPDVRRMARRFARGKENRDVSRWGAPGVGREKREAPTRAKVLGLRRFWEKVGREGVGA